MEWTLDGEALIALAVLALVTVAGGELSKLPWRRSLADIGHSQSSGYGKTQFARKRHGTIRNFLQMSDDCLALK